MTIAVGVAKLVAYKVESTWGSLPGASGGQLLRRVTCDIDLKKDTYQSNEIRPDYQVSDFRHGIRRIEGGINGELSPGTYKDFVAACLRQPFQTASTTGAVAVIAASSSAPQFVRSTGSFITNGFKVGDVVRASGFVATGNNSKNFYITALTATDMTGIFLNGDSVTTEAAGATVTIAVQGKKTWTPLSGHTDLSFSIEQFYSDVAQSEVATGCKISQMTFGLPATGMATTGIQFMGKDSVDSTSQYFTTPTAATATGVLAAVNGYVYVAGVAVALITGATITVDGTMTTEAVVGSNVRPDIFEGSVKVSGQLTVLYQDAVFRNIFTQETEAAINMVFTTANSATAEFVSFSIPRVKAGGAAKDDGEKGLVQTVPFTALLNSAGGSSVNTLATTLSYQDSTA